MAPTWGITGPGSGGRSQDWGAGGRAKRAPWALAQCLLTLQSEKVGIPWPALEQQRAVCLLVSHSSPPPHPLPT